MRRKYKSSATPLAGETNNPLVPGTPEKPGIDIMAILVKFTDGTYRQVVIERKTEKAILNVIVVMENQIRVLNDPLVGIEFNRNLSK